MGIENDIEKGDLGKTNVTASSQANGFTDLSRLNTTITLTPEQFEKIYLAPLNHRHHGLAKQLGNPTPLSVPFSYRIRAVTDRFRIQGACQFCLDHNARVMRAYGLEGRWR